ncbi:ParB/RepB/Spo0J family partition protein [Enterococcus pseudoavium]|uniref:ParB/RepB/Spo0J family partition protein n=1 Tax=Enterococcus pseudoavium TaxID=44007 RepID=UPI000836E0DB|nr:ParB/RepB/Spo0J family partition protein [Enterococcus pseudoavium]
MEFSTVNINELKEDKTLSKLVPEMTTDEYEHFVDSVKKSGVQTPIHIRNDMTILDGRHRVRACKQLGIMEIECLVHNFDKSESIEFVRDTAIERRNLTPVQRADIVLRSDDLIGKIRNQAKENQGARNDLTSRSSDPKVKQYSTRKKLADIAGISESTMKRVMRAKKEDEELYKKVVSGEVSPKKSERIIVEKKKSNVVPINIPKPMTPDETKMLMAVENLDLNFNQIIHYVDNNGEKLYDAICQTYEERPEFMEKAHTALHQLLNLMDAYKGGKHNDKTI